MKNDKRRSLDFNERENLYHHWLDNSEKSFQTYLVEKGFPQVSNQFIDTWCIIDHYYDNHHMTSDKPLWTNDTQRLRYLHAYVRHNRKAI